MRYLWMILVLTATGCVSQGTANLTPSTIIETQGLSQVRDALASSCAAASMSVTASTRNNITCSKPLDSGSQGFFYRALLTEPNASMPEIYSSFSIYQRSDGIGVSVTEWVQHQNAFGKTTKNYLKQKKSLRGMQDYLDKLKGRLDGCGPSNCSTKK
tara:strand:+ start:2069 stop:2539 length:471 start_codon:yes stop_codon:yes gene_type:complete